MTTPSSPTSVVYDVRELSKTYPRAAAPANDRISLSVHAGEVFGLLGPNGAGKTTLVRQMTGLARPTSGEVRLLGVDVVRRPEAVAEYVAVQPQRATALLDLTAQEAIYHTGRLRGLRRASSRADTADTLAVLGIEALARRRVRHLSGGEQRLVSLAVTLIADRPILILDEPTNELDPVARRHVWDHLLALNAAGRTIVLVTHDVLEAERVIERVGLINNGRLVASGRVTELRRRVAQQVRVEVTFGQGAGYDRHLFDDSVQPVRTGERTILLVPRDAVRTTMETLLEKIGLDAIKDFRVLGPSLEDVYLQFGGEHRGG